MDTMKRIITEKLKKLYSEEDIFDRQRFLMLFLFYLPFTIIAVIAEAAGLTGPKAQFFNYTHLGYITATAVLTGLFLKRRIKTAACLSALTIAGALTISVEIIYTSFEPTTSNIILIMANVVLLALNTMASMTAVLKWNTIVLGTMTIGTYITCMIISESPEMRDYLVLFIIAFSLIGISGFWTSKLSYRLKKENTQYKKDEIELLNMLHLRKNEVSAYFLLTSEKSTEDHISTVLESLDKKTRYNLISNMEKYMKKRDTDLKTIGHLFPEFSQSEREICRLILQGKKLGEICTLLNKTETNINSQRANMRKKLGLKSSDNLQEKIRQQFDSQRS